MVNREKQNQDSKRRKANAIDDVLEEKTKNKQT